MTPDDILLEAMVQEIRTNLRRMPIERIKNSVFIAIYDNEAVTSEYCVEDKAVLKDGEKVFTLD